MHYVTHLCQDKKLKKLLGRQPAFRLKLKKDIYLHLCASVISQQLSVKAADVIYKRFLNLYNGKKPTPQQICATPLDILRSVGLSAAKAGYVHNIAKFATEQGMEFHKLRKMDNEQVIAYITQIKGVGRWTAEMLLMFALQREDVFPAGDLGIQVVMRDLYKLDTSDQKALIQRMLSISQKWAPYRTYACMHLWAWKDGE